MHLNASIPQLRCEPGRGPCGDVGGMLEMKEVSGTRDDVAAVVTREPAAIVVRGRQNAAVIGAVELHERRRDRTRELAKRAAAGASSGTVVGDRCGQARAHAV